MIANNTSDADATVLRGPNLGPLGPAHVVMDNCHPSDAGRTFVGQQLSAYFDD
ncbi:MAG: hypothetical protein ACKV2T_02095 [Kofleriaceae bacterium]